ncbi:tail protein [Pseudomonas phage Littlefix]|uniref:Tail fiber protein n=1 Tax=Pseudomonas phage Littlefix TaxID=2079289 RepID=A0A2K9VHT9_9CAUD|nr:tail protein [Pseudomonas phage Littlefix]AUV61903.1 hypothetical protein PsPhLittlefix_gp88 [Pseudomonas phage Littlefix]
MTTRVEFEFYDPDGAAYTNKPFVIKLANAGFIEEQDGVVLPDTIYAVTDEFGKAIVEIMPTSTPYFVHVPSDEISYNDCCVPDLARFKFYVPVTNELVKAQDLFIQVPPSTTAYDEEAIRLITEAKVAAVNAATQAKESADRAELAATTIEGDADDAREAAISAKADAKIASDAAALAQGAIDESAASALAAQEAAAQALANKEATDLAVVTTSQNAESATASEESATTASHTASEKAAIAVTAANATAADAASALDSKNAAKTSQDAAKASEDITVAAAQTAVAAKDQVVEDAANAHNDAIAAGLSKDAAASSELAATTAANQTALDRTAVSQAAAQVATDAGQVALDRAASEQAATEAKAARDEAVDAASAITGALIEYGSIDLSSNTYPPKPNNAGFWKVTVGGVVDGIDYGVGDTLVYSKTEDQFYKIDNTESVSSVNGETGVVVLTKASIGLPLVDNTPDNAKPVSGPQATAIASKEPVIAAGTELQYLNGLKQWVSIYASVRAASLTGFVTDTATAVTALDTVLVALGKLQAQITSSAADINNRAMKGANSDITSLSGLTTPLSIAQGGNGALVGESKASANDPLNNGKYTTSGTWTGSVFPGADSRNQGYLQHDNWTATDYAFQSWISIDPEVTRRQRFKTAGVWGEWVEIKSGGGAGMAVGTTYPWTVSRATIPAGSVPRDGQLLDRATWPDLWALYSTVAIDDSVWLAAPYDKRGLPSKGNGTTTFRMPDTNGKAADGFTISAMTLRGDGRNSAGSAGLHQTDQFQGFRLEHSLKPNYMLQGLNSGYPGASNSASLFGAYFQQVGINYFSLPKFSADGANGTPRFGAETRGSNETVIWCTHGAAKEVNTGSVDVTALATTVVQHTADIAKLQQRKVTQLLGAGHGVLNFLVNGSVYSIMGLPTTYATTGAARGFQAGNTNASSWRFGLPGCSKVPIPDGSPVVKIGGNGICNFALCANGNLYSWGNQSGGQFGIGNTTAQGVPVLSNTAVLDAYSHITNSSLSTGETRFFIKKADGIYSAGNNQYGAAGVGSTAQVLNWTLCFPVATGTVKNLWNLGALYGCTFLQTTDNRLFACGYNLQGQLGTGDAANKLNFVDVTTNWGGSAAVAEITEITGGYGFQSTSVNSRGCTVVFAANKWVRTSGSNEYGQVGKGSAGDVTTPFNVPLVSLPKDCVVAGDGPCNVFVVGQDDKLYVWGHNGQGQDGTGTAGNKFAPTAVPAFSAGGVDRMLNRGFSRNTYAYGHSSFVKMKPVNGSIAVWSIGRSGLGQTCTGNLTDATVPVRTMLPGLDLDGSPFDPELLGQLNTEASEAGGATFVCVSAKGTVVAWGNNSQKGLFETPSAGVYENTAQLFAMPWNQ